MAILRAREAIMFACHCSENMKKFNTDRLVRWFVQSIHDKNLHHKTLHQWPSTTRQDKSPQEAFQTAINKTVDSVWKDKKLQSLVAQEIAEHEAQRVEQSLIDGYKGALQARKRLSEANREALRERERKFQMITMNEKCLRAAHFEQLVTRDWRDDPKCWKVQSRLNGKQLKRLEELT